MTRRLYVDSKIEARDDRRRSIHVARVTVPRGLIAAGGQQTAHRRLYQQRRQAGLRLLVHATGRGDRDSARSTRRVVQRRPSRGESHALPLRAQLVLRREL
jgi:hypothetical protein